MIQAAFVLICIVLFSLLLVYCISNHKIKSIANKYPLEVCVLLYYNDISELKILTMPYCDRKIVLSFAREDYKQWRELREEIEIIKGSYPEALFSFIKENCPDVFSQSRIQSKYLHPQESRYDKELLDDLIECLNFQEVQLIVKESAQNWEKRTVVLVEAKEIALKYRNGIKSFIKIHPGNTGNIQLVQNKKEIIELEKQFQSFLMYFNWYSRQKSFSEDFFKNYETTFNSKHYKYDVKFRHPDQFSNLRDSSFPLYITTYYPFAEFSPKLDSEYIERSSTAKQLKERQSSIKKECYDEMFALIQEAGTKYDSKILVVICNSGPYHLSQETIDYQYSHIIEKVVESSYDWCYSSDFFDNYKETDEEYEAVFFMDFMTKNESIFENCEYFLSHFKKHIPCIGYFPVTKELSEDELQEIYKNGERERERKRREEQERKKREEEEERNRIEQQRREDKAFIKFQFSRVTKHPFYSYVAITNTLIGNATQADIVIKKWLDPDCHCRFYCTNGSYVYTLDGETYYDLPFVGNSQNIDDVVDYTYKLFKEMGVLSNFKNCGAEAIDYMNDHRILAYH